MTNSIITTDKAKCRDCYRCVRVCPIKAIRIADGQARVDAERCILCGTCVRECPQQAKHVRNDIVAVRELLSSKNSVIASVAPSFPAAFPELGNGYLVAALKKLGFAMVTETSVGAELVAHATADLLEETRTSWVTSACPVVVNFARQYFPQACAKITPLASPMIAHGRYLKDKFGEKSKVVFIGPCAAKKAEADEDQSRAIDAVLTFEELSIMLSESEINRKDLQTTAFDDVRPVNAQLFPLEGGLGRTAAIGSDLLREDFIGLSGEGHVREMIAHLGSESPIRLFEALFCPGGCINGPCIGHAKDVYARRAVVLKFHRRKTFEAEEVLDAQSAKHISLRAEIAPRPILLPQFSEDEIRAVLEQTGKHSPADELNCGACGYASCRENASAVLSGMAERNMCLPWMRQLAERKADQIIESSPNAIIVVDSALSIVSFNPAFATMFSCSDAIYGRPLSTLFDPADFEKVAAEVVDGIIGEVTAFPEYNTIANQSIYRLEDEHLLIGIFVNVTKSKEEETKIARMRSETLANAEQVIERQMRMAQEIASILGETTSETRVLLRKLTDLAREADKQENT